MDGRRGGGLPLRLHGQPDRGGDAWRHGGGFDNAGGL